MSWSKIEVFLVFHTDVELKQYIDKKEKSKSFEIVHVYTNIPIVLIQTNRINLEKIKSDKLVQKIDWNSRCYLSNITINDEEDRPFSLKQKYFKDMDKPIKVAIVDSGIDRNRWGCACYTGGI